MFAPSAPFSGPVARLEFVSALATHLGPSWTGKTFARAADFAAAVSRHELDYAVVDAPYLAALGVPYRVLAVAERGGTTAAAWELVSTGATDLEALRGKSIAMPDVGAKNEAFLSEVLLAGDIGQGFFGQVTYSPDALSALAAVERGRADAAFVPASLTLPAGVRRVTTLKAVSWPVLVALPGVTPSGAVIEAAARFKSDVFTRFVPGNGDDVRALAARFTRKLPRAPFITPEIRASVAAMLAGRDYQIARPDPRAYLQKPVPRAGVHR